MATRVSTGLTAAEGRKFAFTLTGAFLVVAGVAWFRNKDIVRMVALSLASLLALAGILVPAHLRPVYDGWMKLAHFISRFTTPIFLSVVFFLVIWPTGLLMRWFGRRPLNHEPIHDSYWKDAPSGGRARLTTPF